MIKAGTRRDATDRICYLFQKNYNQMEEIKKWLKERWDEVLLFLQNIPMTFRESIKWFLMTYMMPAVQIFIIWGIKQGDFDLSLEIQNIVLVTNASLYSAIMMVVTGTKKDRGLFQIATIAAYVVTVVLFAISMVEINMNIKIFKGSLYKLGTIVTFVIALLLGLISKYDEVKAKRIKLANEGKKVKDAKVNEEDFEL